MAVVRKTISIPEDLYKQVADEGKGFSEVVRQAIEEYIQRRKKEKAMTLWGKLKDWGIEEGIKYTDEVRKEQLSAQKQRETWLDT